MLCSNASTHLVGQARLAALAEADGDPHERLLQLKLADDVVEDVQQLSRELLSELGDALRRADVPDGTAMAAAVAAAAAASAKRRQEERLGDCRVGMLFCKYAPHFKMYFEYCELHDALQRGWQASLSLRRGPQVPPSHACMCVCMLGSL